VRFPTPSTFAFTGSFALLGRISLATIAEVVTVRLPDAVFASRSL